MEDITPIVRGLVPAQIEQFISDGFVRIGRAFGNEGLWTVARRLGVSSACGFW